MTPTDKTDFKPFLDFWGEHGFPRTEAELAAMQAPPDTATKSTGEAIPAPDTGTKADGNAIPLLAGRLINLRPVPEKPVPVLTLAGQTISTAGNLTVISGQSKAGKSSVIGGMIASLLAADLGVDGCDCLGFTAAPSSGKATLHIDTEQSKYDAWRLVSAAAKRVDPFMESMPPNFLSYSTTGMQNADRHQALPLEMKRAAEAFGGIHVVIIDGIADLAGDPNDGPGSFAFVEGIIALAADFDCPLIIVLHENPASAAGGSNGKTRGHLGSHLERKAESNLRIEKAGEISVIYSEKMRSGFISKKDGIKFKYDAEAGMHVTYDGDAELSAKDAKRRAELQDECDAVFDGAVGSLTWAELKRGLREGGSSAPTAERRIKEWARLHMVRKSSGGGYVRCIGSDDESGNAPTAAKEPEPPQESPLVVHVRKAPFDEYIGRACPRGRDARLRTDSRWANPFKIGEDGSREEVIQKYREWFWQQDELVSALPELKGKTLGCWCAPEACHGDLLASWANGEGVMEGGAR